MATTQWDIRPVVPASARRNERASDRRDRRAPQGGARVGITSVCSAHPMVIEAAMAQALRRGHEPVVLIEATSNQVNQDGGYTGMSPGRLPRLRAAASRRGRFPARPAGAGRRSPRAERLDRAAGRGRDGQGRNDGRRLRARRLPQDPSRLLDALRGRSGRSCRRTSSPNARRNSAARPNGRDAGGRRAARSMSSARKSLCRAALRRISARLAVTTPDAALATIEPAPRPVCPHPACRRPGTGCRHSSCSQASSSTTTR